MAWRWVLCLPKAVKSWTVGLRWGRKGCKVVKRQVGRKVCCKITTRWWRVLGPSRARSSPSVQTHKDPGRCHGPGPWSEPEPDLVLSTLPDSPSSDDSWATPSGLFFGSKAEPAVNGLDMFSVLLSEEEPSLGVVQPVRPELPGAVSTPGSVAATDTPASTDLSMPLVSFRERCRLRKAALLPRPAPKRPRKK
jgi:hypothetical protein